MLFADVVGPCLDKREQRIILGTHRGAHAAAQLTADRVGHRNGPATSSPAYVRCAAPNTGRAPPTPRLGRLA